MMPPLINTIIYGRSSFDSSILCLLPAPHHRRFAQPVSCAGGVPPIPDNKKSIFCGGSYAPAIVSAGDRNSRRDSGRADPAYRDGSFTAAGSERRPEEI